MQKFIKKPSPIEAAQWKGTNLGDARRFTATHDMPQFKMGINGDVRGLAIETLEGIRIAAKGDFIIKGVEGEYYPCKPKKFKATYYTEEEYAKLDS